MKPSPDLLASAPKYAQIAQELRADIAQGRFPAGEQLPTVAEMTERFGVAKHTLERAYAILEQAGLIRREQGRGVFVNSAANAKKSGLIGYLDLYQSYTSHSPYFHQIQNGARSVANQAGKNLVIIDSPSTFAHWDSLEGLLLCEMGDYNRHELQNLIPPGLPTVNLFFNDSYFPSVQPDDAAGVRLLVEHLVNLGHRKIAYLGRVDGHILPVRHRAYREVLLRHGIEPLDEWTFEPTAQNSEGYGSYGYRAMQAWIEDGWAATGCTAILAQNDLTAHGVICALQEHDIRVPEDVSVVGFDGISGIINDGVNNQYWLPIPLTTIQVPVFDIAVTAMDLLTGDPANLPIPRRPLVLPVTFHEGQSSAVPLPVEVAGV